MIPANIKAAIDRHVQYGIEQGSFVNAVLENNLRDAINRADSDSAAALFDIVAYVMRYIPSAAWGSREKVLAWREARMAEVRARMEPGP